jgi:hypothetical protein
MRISSRARSAPVEPGLQVERVRRLPTGSRATTPPQAPYEGIEAGSAGLEWRELLDGLSNLTQ